VFVGPIGEGLVSRMVVDTPVVEVLVSVLVAVAVDVGEGVEDDCSTLSTEDRYELTAAFVLVEEVVLRAGPPGVRVERVEDGAAVEVDVDVETPVVTTEVEVEVDGDSVDEEEGEDEEER